MIAAIDGVRHAGEGLLSGLRTGLEAAERGLKPVLERLPEGLRSRLAADEFPAGDAFRGGDVFKGAAAGLLGGVVASWAMNRFHSAMSSASQKRSPACGRTGRDTGSGSDGPAGVAELEQGKRASDQNAGQEPATVQVAQAVSRSVAQHELTTSEKRAAGPAVHYGYGAAMGGLYGGLVEAAPVVETGFGTAYAAALWLIGDEIAIPALGLGKAPTETRASEHAKALAAHLVYGLTLEGVRRLVRRPF